MMKACFALVEPFLLLGVSCEGQTVLLYSNIGKSEGAWVNGFKIRWVEHISRDELGSKQNLKVKYAGLEHFN